MDILVDLIANVHQHKNYERISGNLFFSSPSGALAFARIYQLIMTVPWGNYDNNDGTWAHARNLDKTSDALTVSLSAKLTFDLA